MLSFRYQFEELFFHWGLDSGDRGGSEHSIGGQAFPAEIQLYGFNSQLYSNLTEARTFPGGVVAVSVMVSPGSCHDLPSVTKPLLRSS